MPRLIKRGLTKYVKCIPTTKKSFLKHTDERVQQASQLACCVSMRQNLPKCTKQVAGYRYRRLEYYAEELGLIERIRFRKRKWIAYGKLVELTFYIKYQSVKERWNRHLEIRILLGVPLHQSCRDLTGKGTDYWIDIVFEYLYYHDPRFEKYLIDVIEAGAVVDWVKTGCREITSKTAKCSLPTWCNGAYKIDYNCNPSNSIKYLEIYDYRGYSYRYGDNPCA